MRRMLSLILFALLGFSCEEGSPEPFLRGDFIGSISLIMDEFGQPMNDRSGYEVTFEGSDPERKVVSDADGNFVVEDLTTGTYNLIFSKPGFETRKVFSVQFTGGNVPTYYYAPMLSQRTTTAITSFSIAVTDEGNTNPAKYTMVKIESSTQPEATQQYPRNRVVFVHTESSVSDTNFSFPELHVTEAVSLIRLNKIESGTTLYAVAYPTPVSCNPYFDPAASSYIHTCFGEPTTVVEFTVP